MKNNFVLELGSAAVFVVLALLLANPMELWMPSMAYMAALAGAIVALATFLVFVVHEQEGDERDNEHRSFAGRVAFLAGAGVLLLGVALQTLSHRLDLWLVTALVAMVVAKVLARLYSERNR